MTPWHNTNTQTHRHTLDVILNLLPALPSIRSESPPSARVESGDSMKKSSKLTMVTSVGWWWLGRGGGAKGFRRRENGQRRVWEGG